VSGSVEGSFVPAFEKSPDNLPVSNEVRKSGKKNENYSQHVS